MGSSFWSGCIFFLGIILAPISVSACGAGGHFDTRTFYPACEIEAPRAEERVTAIQVYSGAALSPVYLEAESVVTEVVDIEIGAAEKPHYIVLSSGKAIIWRFHGRTDLISRIVVLGSQESGAQRAGVIGVAREKVRFASTNIKELPGSCSLVRYACSLALYFNLPTTDKEDVLTGGAAPTPRYRVDQYVNHFRTGVIHIPQGTSDGKSEREFKEMTFDARAWRESRLTLAAFFQESYRATNRIHERGVADIIAEDVLSPKAVGLYRTLPGGEGIRQLIDAKALIGPDDARFAATYAEWNEAISKPFRTALNPGFSFSYPVDYMIAARVVLPAGLGDAKFLTPLDVPAPEQTAGGTCVFYNDHRQTDERIEDQSCPFRFSFGRLPPEQLHCGQALHCNSGFFEGRHEALALAESHWRETFAKSAEADPNACRVTTLPQDAHFASIAVSAPAPSWSHRLKVEVLIKRPGPVVLYLDQEQWGDVEWRLVADPGSEIAALFGSETVIREGSKAVIEIEGRFPQLVLLDFPRKTECGTFVNPRARHHGAYGGPAARLLDDEMRILTGRGLDRLLRRSSQSDQPLEKITFVVD